MKRKIITLTAAAALTFATGMTAYAFGWQQNATGWWYGTNADNSKWYSNGWQWIDGNGDGVAESYYFDSNGYIAVNMTTPDGYTVNENGAWVSDGIVQTKTNNTVSTASGSLDRMLGKWKLTEIKEGSAENVANIYSLDGFTNIKHWSDWQISYTGMESIELQKQADGYCLLTAGGGEEQFTGLNDKTLYFLSTIGDRSSFMVEHKPVNTYCFMDGDHLVITGENLNFITNNNERKSGSYFLGYYTREN